VRDWDAGKADADPGEASMTYEDLGAAFRWSVVWDSGMLLASSCFSLSSVDISRCKIRVLVEA